MVRCPKPKRRLWRKETVKDLPAITSVSANSFTTEPSTLFNRQKIWMDRPPIIDCNRHVGTIQWTRWPLPRKPIELQQQPSRAWPSLRRESSTGRRRTPTSTPRESICGADTSQSPRCRMEKSIEHVYSCGRARGSSVQSETIG